VPAVLFRVSGVGINRQNVAFKQPYSKRGQSGEGGRAGKRQAVVGMHLQRSSKVPENPYKYGFCGLKRGVFEGLCGKQISAERIGNSSGPDVVSVTGSELALVISAPGMIRLFRVKYRVNRLYPADSPMLRDKTVSFKDQFGSRKGRPVCLRVFIMELSQKLFWTIARMFPP